MGEEGDRQGRRGEENLIKVMWREEEEEEEKEAGRDWGQHILFILLCLPSLLCRRLLCVCSGGEGRKAPPYSHLPFPNVASGLQPIYAAVSPPPLLLSPLLVGWTRREEKENETFPTGRVIFSFLSSFLSPFPLSASSPPPPLLPQFFHKTNGGGGSRRY